MKELDSQRGEWTYYQRGLIFFWGGGGGGYGISSVLLQYSNSPKLLCVPLNFFPLEALCLYNIIISLLLPVQRVGRFWIH